MDKLIIQQKSISTEEKETLFHEQYIRLVVTRAELYVDYPSLYETFDNIEMIIDEKIPSMGVCPLYNEQKQLTGRYRLFWSPWFTVKLTNKQLLGVLIHELLHILLKHCTIRQPFKPEVENELPYERDRKQQIFANWNIATDLSINSFEAIKELLQDQESSKRIGVFPNVYGLFPKKNAEYYFKELGKYKQQQQKSNKYYYESNQFDNHDDWVDSINGIVQIDKINKVDKSKHIDKSESEINDTDIDEIDKNKEDPLKKLDKISKELNLDEFAEPGNSTATTDSVKLNAGKEKKAPEWMKQTTHSSAHGYNIMPQLTRKVPNKRYGLLFPGKRRQHTGNKLLVAIDVSGSINRNLYDKFCEHLNHLLRFADYDMIFFNSNLLHNGKPISPENAEKACIKFKKGMEVKIDGGTDFEPIIQFWNIVNKKYDGLFIFTDGEASYKTIPKSSRAINWIVYGNTYYTNRNLKHGKIHIVKDE